MSDRVKENLWQIRIVKPFWPWSSSPMRPAEIARGLYQTTLARENLLEDANYQKIVPNRFIVEINEENYIHNFQPIEKRVIDQWREGLLEYLTTANGRMGRREYRFGGPVQIEIRPSQGLPPNRARVLSMIEPGVSKSPLSSPDLPACLVESPAGKRWVLRQGTMIIGRDPGTDIYLDALIVREKRLVSGKHANLRIENGQYRLYDGTPDGKRSLNGTYVNFMRVPPGGISLKNGDVIILASLNPEAPRSDTPGVVTLRFLLDCKE